MSTNLILRRRGWTKVEVSLTQVCHIRFTIPNTNLKYWKLAENPGVARVRIHLVHVCMHRYRDNPYYSDSLHAVLGIKKRGHGVLTTSTQSPCGDPTVNDVYYVIRSEWGDLNISIYLFRTRSSKSISNPSWTKPHVYRVGQKSIPTF